MSAKKQDKNNLALKWIHNNSKKIYLQIACLTVLAMLMSVVSVRFVWASKAVIDTATKAISGNLTNKIGELVVLVLAQVTIQILYSKVGIKLTTRFSIKLKENLFNRVLKKNWQKITEYHSGEILNRINSDISIIVTGVMSLIPSVCALALRIILSFYSLFALDRTLAAVCLILAPFILVSTRIYGKRMKGLHKKCQETDGRTKSFMQECIQNLLVIKAYRNQDRITEESSRLQMDNYYYTIKRNNISILMNILFFLVLTAGYYLSLAYCAVKVSQGIMTYGTLMAILQLINAVQVPFKDLAGLVPQYYSAIASTERIMEIENSNDDENITEVNTNWQKIIVENLEFAYKDEKIFKNANLTFEDGDFLAICGISGIGKSTLMKLMMGILQPDVGKISITYGKKAETKKSLYSYVPQGNMILSGTIKENIAFFTEINDEYIIKAAKVADIYDFIQTLPEGFDTKLGEKGLGLSEGQVQRLAIARAIYFDAPVILLDEATSALDEQTELRVLNNIKELKNKSCIIISHKNAAFKICNKRIAIKDMQITEMP